MSFLQRLRETIMRFMQNRHGPDNLGMFTLIAGLVASILGSLTGTQKDEVWHQKIEEYLEKAREAA